MQITPLAQLLSLNLANERRETFRCIACHPYYQSQTPEDQTLMKQDLVELFNRRYTWGVATIRGLMVPLEGPLLKFGDDYALRAEDGLDTGGHDDGEREISNNSAWAHLSQVGCP